MPAKRPKRAQGPQLLGTADFGNVGAWRHQRQDELGFVESGFDLLRLGGAAGNLGARLIVNPETSSQACTNQFAEKKVESNSGLDPKQESVQLGPIHRCIIRCIFACRTPVSSPNKAASADSK